jgi:hypothetical protein
MREGFNGEEEIVSITELASRDRKGLCLFTRETIKVSES